MTNASPAPGTPQTGAKAYIAGAIAFTTAVGGYYVADDDPFTRKEMVEAFLMGLGSLGLGGVLTYVLPNRAK
jgi:hypothetical protein